ncbi:MAG: type II toxin-antitoxin system HicA family toxin [Patescibacteria group bacterium]|nr:type II toxin-antitoxin system HicA family toxin [Patescibacteria group bacterium]
MSKQDKLLTKFYASPPPNDFKWDDFVTLMKRLGFTLEFNGRGGSHCTFFKDPHQPLHLAKPHPDSVLKTVYIKKVKIYFDEIGLNDKGEPNE